MKQAFSLLNKLLPAAALVLLLGGCPELMGSANPPDRTPLVATYPIAGGINTNNIISFLHDHYLLFSLWKDRNIQVAFDIQQRKSVWEASFFPNGHYYISLNDKYAYVWPNAFLPGELQVVEPSTGEIMARVNDPVLTEGAYSNRFYSIVATTSRVYATSGRSGIAVFDLDPVTKLPSFVRKVTVPDVENVVSRNPRVFYVMAIAADPDSHDVFVGATSDREFGSIPDLYRVDTDTGTVEWKAEVEYPDNGEDAIAGRYAGHVSVVTLAGDVLIIQAGQSVQAFDPETGERYWYYELRCEGGVPGALTDSQLYVPETGRIFFGRGSQSCFYSVAASADGPDPWTLDTQDYPGHAATPQEGLPTYLDGVLYFYNGFLWAVDPYTGKPLSVSREMYGWGIVISIFNDGRYIYVPLDEGIYAFEPVRR